MFCLLDEKMFHLHNRAIDRGGGREIERKKLMYMYYKHKDAFSLRDGVGTCPNINVEEMLQINLYFSLDHII